MRSSHFLVSYLFAFCLVTVFVQETIGGEYQPHYANHEAKQYEYVQEYHPPPPKKSAQVDINIPIDFGTIAKLGVIGLTQLKLLLALGKVAGAGLGVSALGLGSLGKLALNIAPKKGINIDLQPVLGKSHHHHYEHHHPAPEKHHY